MTNTLRLIAVHVEETAVSRYQWVLTERAEAHEWHELDRSASTVTTYKKAMAQGLLALQALIDDPDAGPRRKASPRKGDSEERGSPVPEVAEPDIPASRKGSLFGFGPAR